ncbi:MAG: tetratricopeptide repeat protein [Gammaproteobacteria bacterium]|nr:tetratricopeptide repeat protein [Gammaproteobacteria bacterium]
MIQFSALNAFLPSVRITLFILCTLILSFSPDATFSQGKKDLDYLIFDPVLLDPGSSQEIRTNNAPTFNDYGLAFSKSSAVSNQNNQSATDIMGNIRGYENQLTELQVSGGPFSQELFQVLLDLGTQHQQLGDHATAIETFERAEFISRINDGLDNPNQYVSIEKTIESHLAMGDIASANQKQRYLVFLGEQYFGANNLSSLPTLISIAEQNMLRFNQVISKPREPVFSFVFTSGNTPTGLGGDRRPSLNSKASVFGNLFIAQQNYYRAITTLLQNRAYFDPLLLNLEYNLLETLFLTAYRSAILDESDYYLSERSKSTGSLISFGMSRRYSFNYYEGKNVFERMLIYLENNPDADTLQLIDTTMEYGDWNLLFNKGVSARRKYEEAWQFMKNLGVENEMLDSLFRPQMPVHLPRFTAKPNSREKFSISTETELEYEGYVDIAFTISKYGRAKRFEFLNSEGEITKRIESRLRRYLRNSPFRPRLDDQGKTVADRVTMRYYVAFADTES